MGTVTAFGRMMTGEAIRKQKSLRRRFLQQTIVESAIIENLPANGAAFTAIVRGVNGSTGVALVKVYALQ